MQEIILEIFDKVNTAIPDLIQTEKDIEQQVETIIEAIQAELPQEYHEFFEAANIAERRGFELGMKCMAKLIFESLS